jgi:hypothetical protein
MPGCVLVSGRLPASYGPSVTPLPTITVGGSEPAFLLSFKTFATAFCAMVSDVMVKMMRNRWESLSRVGSVGLLSRMNAQSGGIGGIELQN